MATKRSESTRRQGLTTQQLLNRFHKYNAVYEWPRNPADTVITAHELAVGVLLIRCSEKGWIICFDKNLYRLKSRILKDHCTHELGLFDTGIIMGGFRDAISVPGPRLKRALRTLSGGCVSWSSYLTIIDG